MKEAKLIAFIGLPAVGKSTVRKQLLESGKIDEAISPDEVRLREFKTQFDPKLESQVWSIVKARMGRCLSEGNRCLLDATNLDRERRQDFSAIADALGAKKEAIVLNMDFDIAMNRNKRSPVVVEGLEVGQTVPDAAMYRMRYQWDESGLGHAKKSIEKALNKEFDEVSVINRYADEKDCQEMSGKIVYTRANRKACAANYKDDLSLSRKLYYME